MNARTHSYRNRSLSASSVRHSLSDINTITTRELNGRTARILDAMENGENFDLRRNGKALGYLTHTPPPPESKPEWKAHFEWLRIQQATGDGCAWNRSIGRTPFNKPRASQAGLRELCAPAVTI